MFKKPIQYDPDAIDPLDDNPDERTASHAFDADTGAGVNISLSDDLSLKVIEQRNYFQQYIRGHFFEVILSLRQYANIPVSVNTAKVEYYLRNGHDVILGKNNLGKLCMLGVSNNQHTSTAPTQNFVTFSLTGQNITWLIPDYLKPKVKDWSHFTEITYEDGAKTGQFVVLRNKPFTYTNDFQIIETYSHRIAEIQASRYSLILQSKYSKMLQGDPTNNTLNTITEKIYNGAPFIKTTSNFIPDRDIIDLGNDHVSDTMRGLKQEYNDEINELNNFLGINTTGIDKDSGVTTEEVNSNNDAVSSTANKYLSGVQSALDLLNIRYGYDMHVYLNQNPKAVTK